MEIEEDCREESKWGFKFPLSISLNKKDKLGPINALISVAGTICVIYDLKSLALLLAIISLLLIVLGLLTRNRKKNYIVKLLNLVAVIVLIISLLLLQKTYLI